MIYLLSMQMSVPFNLTALTLTATEMFLINTPRTTDCPSSPWVTLQIKDAKQQRNVSNSGGENRDLLCRDRSSPTTVRRGRNSSCRQKQNYASDKVGSSSSRKDLFYITDQLSKKDSTLLGSIPADNLPKTQRLRDEPDATSGQPDFSVFCGPHS